MAFRTNKVPAIEERTVSGSSVSFNSAFALPLKACKVSFSATQAGSGDPSPSNPRAISGVSAIGLTANSTPVSVSLGEERFGGELDVLTGILTVTHSIIELDGSNDEVYTNYSSYNGFTLYVSSAKSGTNMPCMCNWLKTQVDYSEFGLRIGSNSSRFYFLHITDNISGVSDIVSWRAYLGEHPLEIAYELAEPITIQLSANELSSIIGNNTFSTDTGTLEITFADLQEKSASGSVATFNTALAMPLASCNIAVNAWQEGSGEPSPSNVRAIHGFSVLNATANNVVHTIQLGQEVYGAEVDVVNGVGHVNRAIKVLDGTHSVTVQQNYIKSDACCGIVTFNDIYPRVGVSSQPDLLCDKLTQSKVYNFWQNVGYPNVWGIINANVLINIDNTSLGITDYTQETTTTVSAKIKAWLENNPVHLIIPIEPFDIQLTPTQIETLIGNNTIFADTGDVDLTYKDLDIAKRGSFREVFMLP